MKKGTKVKIKGYKKIHTITAVFDVNPPKSKSFIAYHISETPSNKRYLKEDLIIVK
jgi:hypothetical protein